MKKWFAVAVLLLAAAGAKAQTSNSLPFTAVTPPPPPALTSLGGLSPTGKIYTGMVMAINGTGFTSSCTVNVDGTAQSASTFAFSSSTLINFTVPASLGSSAGTAHTLTVSCSQPALTMNNPVTLPNAKAGVAYTANLGQLAQVRGGVPPLTYSLSGGSLPTTLALSPSGVVTGTPSSAGLFSFSFTVRDSSGLALSPTLPVQNDIYVGLSDSELSSKTTLRESPGRRECSYFSYRINRQFRRAVSTPPL